MWWLAPAIVRDADARPGAIDSSTYVLIGLLGVGVVMTAVVLVVIAFVLARSAKERRGPRVRTPEPMLDPGSGEGDAGRGRARVIRLQRREAGEGEQAGGGT
ncbi:MAG: hypothetical protein EA378_06200 [Phycisphaerales bacterium]|nr:MAG: hypothetical protein EA378_06200 [Phycisphaerales bacterium]